MPTIGRSPKVSARSAAAVRVALSKNLEKRKRSEKPRNLEIAESWDLSCISSTYVTLHASSPLPLHRVPRTVQHPSAVCRPCLKARITKYKVLLSTKWLGSLRTVASLTLNVAVWSGKIAAQLGIEHGGRECQASTECSVCSQFGYPFPCYRWDVQAVPSGCAVGKIN